jgi:hypothetical protein
MTAEVRNVQFLLMRKGKLDLHPFHSAILQNIFLLRSDMLIVD